MNSESINIETNDYLTIEFLPTENFELIKSDKFDTEVILKGEIEVKTSDKKIPMSKIESILSNFTFKEVNIINFNKNIKGYGTSNFAILIEADSGFIKNISLTEIVKENYETRQLFSVLKKFCELNNFICANWNTSDFFYFNEDSQIQDFIDSIVNANWN